MSYAALQTTITIISSHPENITYEKAWGIYQCDVSLQLACYSLAYSSAAFPLF